MERGFAPDPDQAADLAEFIEELGRLRLWAGSPSYRALAKRVGPLLRPPQTIAHTTVTEVFQPRRRRLDLDLVTAIVRALGVQEQVVERWRAACVRVHVAAKTGGQAAVFRQLPSDLATFTGRDADLKQLIDAATAPAHERAATVVVSAIEGMAGIGKTQLAVHAAHELVRAGHFADVQLYVNLRGFDADHAPTEPGTVLDAFLRQLGVVPQHIPEATAERAAMFRDRLHGRDALIVLDNAAGEDQVRDLVPASPSCLVLITSRRSLSGLTDAVPCQLGLFDEAEALELFTRIVGEARVTAEPGAATAVVQLCGRLPLAVAIAGGQLRRRSAWRIADLVDRLECAGLDAVEPTGGGHGIRSLFGLSVRALPEAAQRVFCWAALFPGSSFTAEAMAAAAGLTPTEAVSILEGLVDEYLVEHRAAGRYELHDLLRLYATEFADSGHGAVPADERRAAEHRLGVHYLAATAAAMDVLYPHQKHRRMEIPQPSTPAPTFAGTHEAQSWLDAEHRNIIGLAVGGLADSVPMSILLWQYLQDVSRNADALRLHDTALAKVPEEDKLRRAQILNQIAISRQGLGRYAEAHEALETAVTLCREIGELRGESITLMNIAVLHSDSGDVAAALDVCHQALAIIRQLRDGWREGDLLNNIGGILVQLDRNTEAIAVLEEAITTTQEHGNYNTHAAAVGNLGHAYLRLGDHDRALTTLTEALALSRKVKRRHSEGENLVLLGRVHAGSGDPERGLAMIRQGLEIGRENGPHYEAAALIALGDTYQLVGDVEAARQHYRDALATADRYRIHQDSPLRAELAAGMARTEGAQGYIHSHGERLATGGSDEGRG